MGVERGAPRWLAAGDRLFAALAGAQARRPVRSLLIAAALAVPFGMFAARLSLRTHFEEMLPASSPSVVELGRLRARVAQGSTISIVLEGPAPEELRVAGERVAQELTRGKPAWLLSAEPGVQEARAFLQHRIGLFAPRERLEGLRDELRQAWAERVMQESGLGLGLEAPRPLPSADDLRERLFTGVIPPELDTRYPEGWFQSQDGHAVVVLVRTSVVLGDVEQSSRVLHEVREQVGRALSKARLAGVRAGYAGDLVTGLGEYSAVRADLVGVGVLGVSMVLMVILLFFARLRIVAALGSTIAVGLAFTFGTTALTIGHLNLATGFLVSVVAGNGINAGIICAARYFEARQDGAPPEAAAVVAGRGTWLPTFGAAVAAAAAYGSLGVSSSLGLKHLAVVGGAGMLLCWVATQLVTLPALVLVERLRPLRFGGAAGGRWIDRLRAAGLRVGRPLLEGAVRRARAIALVSAAAMGVGLLLVISYVRADPMDYDLRNVQTDASAAEQHRLSDLAAEVLGANLEGSMVVLADRADQVIPLRRALEAKRDQAPPDGKPFEAVHTLYDFVAADQEAKIPVLLDIGRLLRRARAAGAVSEAEWSKVGPLLPPPGLKPYGVSDLPEVMVRPFTERDGTAGRLLFIEPTAGQSDSDLHYLLRFTDAFRETALPTGERIQGSGRAVIFADILRSLVQDVPWALGLSLLATIVAVVVTFRRGSLSMLVLGALFAGAIWLVALLDLFRIRMNFINFVALPVTFGIGVDYALNVVQRYANGEGVRGAVRRAGAAVVLCSLTTILSYLALLTSINRAIRSLGLVAVLGEVCCLTAAVVTLPAVLLWWEGRREPERV
jgi:predicted RND superfamily exporter protein